MTEPLEFVAVRLAGGMQIRPALVDRTWMETPAGKFAKRCLPMLIANQAGWELMNPSGFTAQWEGGDELEAVKIWLDPGAQPGWVISHFGSGILTWHIPYLFRTPHGYNLHVRGPANMPKDGISALEGIVETDWTAATFTMNWKFTRPAYPIRFEAEEPIAMVIPARRGELERFRPILREAASEPSILGSFQRFSSSRQEFLQSLKIPGSLAERASWQRNYMLGRDVDGKSIPEHQTKLQLHPFETDKTIRPETSTASLSQSFPDPSSVTNIDALLDLGESATTMVRQLIPSNFNL